MKNFYLLAFLTLLSACDQQASRSAGGFSGTFSSASEKSTVTFTPDGKVNWNGREAFYTVDGPNLKFQVEGGLPVTFVKNPDGSISMYGVSKFKKD